MQQKIKSDLSERFEDVKRHFGLNNSQLSKLAEVTPQAINDIVNGVTDNPRVSLINKIATKLEISIDWLLNGKGQMVPGTEEGKVSQGDSSMLEFMIRQIEEKDKIINHLMSRQGKRRGVSGQPVLAFAA
ncbi:helix-turn-helix domain-containing protein [Spirosoma aerolatum]|uniref:helix-turn-helix domain-containing protein n=1 Tax=Spirosoma aerolatum TaxID=1211326 RepID=UPI0009AE5ED2|nr:helix-turn-helix transcriptional regulator [Spirosoma aerolatum]